MFGFTYPANQPFANSKPDYWFAGRMADAVFLDDAIPPPLITKVAGKSGNAIDVVQTVQADQPTWDGVLNGRTVPLWGAPTVSLENLSGGGFGIGDYTIFAVASHAFGSSDGRIAAHRSISTPANCLFDVSVKGYATPTQGSVRVYDGTTLHETSPGVVSDGVPFMLTILLENGQPNGLIRVNGVDRLSGFTYSPTSAASELRIGKFGGEELAGVLAEILIYKKISEGLQIEYLERYLNNYYNIF